MVLSEVLALLLPADAQLRLLCTGDVLEGHDTVSYTHLIGGDDHLAAHLLPLTQQPGARVEAVSYTHLDRQQEAAVSAGSGMVQDAVEALVALGYGSKIGRAHV